MTIAANCVQVKSHHILPVLFPFSGGLTRRLRTTDRSEKAVVWWCGEAGVWCLGFGFGVPLRGFGGDVMRGFVAVCLFAAWKVLGMMQNIIKTSSNHQGRRGREGRRMVEVHVFAQNISLIFGFLTCALSFHLVFKHLTNFNQPRIQRYIVRILWMVPVRFRPPHCPRCP